MHLRIPITKINDVFVQLVIGLALKDYRGVLQHLKARAAIFSWLISAYQAVPITLCPTVSLSAARKGTKETTVAWILMSVRSTAPMFA